jgi:hypothetical protein
VICLAPEPAATGRVSGAGQAARPRTTSATHTDDEGALTVATDDDSNRMNFPRDNSDDQPPSLDLETLFPPVRTPLEVLADAWHKAWSDGGALFQRWEDLRTTADKGWHGMAHWIKVLITVGVRFFWRDTRR